MHDSERRERRAAEADRRDAEAMERAKADARIDAAADQARTILPGGIGAALAEVLGAMKPFRASDGHLSFRAVGRSSPEVIELAEAILAVIPTDSRDVEALRIYANYYDELVGAEPAPRQEVLRQVAALRLIVGHHHRPILRFVSVRGGDWQWLEGAAAIDQVRTGEVLKGRLECHVCGEAEGGGENPRLPWPCPTITAVASMWAGHPDYDTTWEQR